MVVIRSQAPTNGGVRPEAFVTGNQGTAKGATRSPSPPPKFPAPVRRGKAPKARTPPEIASDGGQYGLRRVL